MTKIALITDTHFGCRNSSLAFMDYQERCFKWFFDYLDENNIKTVIHLGDCLDVRKQVTYVTAKLLRNIFLEELEKRGIETHMITGNHDLVFKNTHEVNALDELVTGRYSHIRTYSTPTLVTIGGLPIQFLPWITQSNYQASIEAINQPRAEIAMGHLELSGFQMFKGTISDHGYDRELFNKFDKVFSGHYHHRSTIGNVTYLGSFIEITWSDFNDPRGFSIFDTETREIEFIRNPHKMFRVVKYDDIAEPDVIEKIQKTDFSVYANSYVKLAVVNKTNPYTFDMLFDAIYKAGPIDIQIVEDVALLSESEDDEAIDEAEDTVTIVSKYIDSLTLPLNSAKLKSFMLDLYSEALQAE